MDDKVREPYTYTMPEQFMADQSVPIQWRLYGVLNGFFISRKTVYATNEWFMEKLGCSERTIQRGIQELEELGIIYCERSGNSRVILPRHELRGTPSPIDTPPRHQLLHNSDNIIQKDTTSAEIGISPSLSLSDSDEDDTPTEDDDVQIIETDSDGEVYQPRWGRKEKSAPKRDEGYKERERMLNIIEATFHKKFFNRAKQHVILKGLLDNGATTKDITSAIKKVAESDYWKERGWDLATISAEMSRK